MHNDQYVYVYTYIYIYVIRSLNRTCLVHFPLLRTICTVLFVHAGLNFNLRLTISPHTQLSWTVPSSVGGKTLRGHSLSVDLFFVEHLHDSSTNLLFSTFSVKLPLFGPYLRTSHVNATSQQRGVHQTFITMRSCWSQNHNHHNNRFLTKSQNQ